MKVLALGGSGDMGRMAVAVLLDFPDLISSITVADKDLEQSKVFVELVGSDKLKAMEIDANPLYVHIHEKIAISFSTLVFMLLGIPLAITTHRKEKTFNIGLILLVAGIYYLSFIGIVALSSQGVLPAVGIWLPNAVLIVFGGFLTYRLCVS